MTDREHELRDRLAYTPPFSEERGRLEHRLREVHYEREQCWRRLTKVSKKEEAAKSGFRRVVQVRGATRKATFSDGNADAD